MCDYLLWGYVKSKAYLRKPRDIYVLQNAIKEEIIATPNKVRETVRTLRDRLEQCRRDDGKHREMCSSKSKICKSSDVVYLNCILFSYCSI